MPLIIREAIAADIPALAELHVKTWNATYPGVVKKPTYEIRERQWREAFAVTDGNWCCFVVEDDKGQADNPSCRFCEALGAERLLDAKGKFHGGYGWRDLTSLAAICPTE